MNKNRQIPSKPLTEGLTKGNIKQPPAINKADVLPPPPPKPQKH